MTKILAYGDSNTFGTGPMSAIGEGVVLSKGARWADRLAESFGSGVEMVVEGLPGRTTVHDDPIEGAYRNGLSVLPAILHSHKPIDLIIICLGTNDQKARFGLVPMDIALGLQRLVREVEASGLVRKTLVIAPPPLKTRGEIGTMFPGVEERFSGLSALTERALRSTSAAFFDAGSVIEVDAIDGIHWSEASHNTLAQALVDPVKALL